MRSPSTIRTRLMLELLFPFQVCSLAIFPQIYSVINFHTLPAYFISQRTKPIWRNCWLLPKRKRQPKNKEPPLKLQRMFSLPRNDPLDKQKMPTWIKYVWNAKFYFCDFHLVSSFSGASRHYFEAGQCHGREYPV